MTEISTSNSAILKFQQLEYVCDPSFFSKAAEDKLDRGLGATQRPLHATYSPSNHASVPSYLHFDHTSFSPTPTTPTFPTMLVQGSFMSLDSLDDYTTLDRAALLQSMLDNMSSNARREPNNPNHLFSFLLVMYCDLKSHKFYHYLCLPTLVTHSITATAPLAPLATVLPDTHLAILRSVETLLRQANANACWVTRQGVAHPWSTAPPLSPDAPLLLALLDTSERVDAPGWTLRNLLSHIESPHSTMDVLLLRTRRGLLDATHSLVATLAMEQQQPPQLPMTRVGWCLNERGRHGPRMTDLASLFSPHALADQAAQLNLRLMRWRSSPSLHLDRIANSSFLLLGAGTLGCEVARTLVGWGARRLTLVDHGRVSFSNPVRQSLYTFADCLDGGKEKASCAAEALRGVCPSIDARGVSLSIPMPGHGLCNATTREGYKTLDALIQSHEVVYLLTDTRESRWLPTLLGALHHKLVLTAALGFDSFLVMRHGRGANDSNRLGCYFCNDIVAPRDSTLHRPLDAQCTITRPGLAHVAGALATELTISCLQHPLFASTRHQEEEVPPLDTSTTTTLHHDDMWHEAVPHMIRGSFRGYSQQCMMGKSYPQCTACSHIMVEKVKEEGWDAVRLALEEPRLLEEWTGLAELQREMESVVIDDEVGGGGGEEGGEWVEM